MDRSNGYEKIAEQFIGHREHDVNRIGASSVIQWAKSLPVGAAVLDLGCGSGIPISEALMEAGLTVYGVDASATMVRKFRENFPDVPVACETVEESDFFNRKFDAVVAWGLMFLLSEDSQERLIHKVAQALQPGGRFLFTAPHQKTEWEDVMTGRTSRSPGAEEYRRLLSSSGFTLVEEFEDEVGNYYYSSVKN